jgi:hypothetical protein
MKTTKWVAAILLIFAYSCKKEEVNHPPKASVSYIQNGDTIKFNGQASSDPDNDLLVYQWHSNEPTVIIKNADKQSAYFTIPQLTENKTITITLIVNDGEFKDSSSVNIDLLANYYIKTWGLGNVLNAELSNNRDYEWYLDQMNTGTYASVNCGPTSTTMAIKWYNKDFPKTPADARNAYRSTGGWWYTSDIVNYLNDNGVNNRTINLTSIDLLKNELNAGNIIILCLDMYYITYNGNGEIRKDKFYTTTNTGWGHFIVIKGYKEVDNITYYEVYDPNSYGRKYSDTSLKGKNRYYSATDLNTATNVWWDYAIVITKSTVKSKGLDIREIPDMPGR